MERTKLDNITRVMGYLRPMSGFNIGKKQEFRDRKEFDLNTTINSKFINDFTI